LANLILSIVLVRSYGLLGVAWGTGIPLIVTQLVFVSRIVCRQTGVGTLGYVGRCIVLPVGCGLALGGAQITLHRMMSTTTYWQLSIVALATSLAFVALMLRLYFSRDERRLFREMRTSWMGGEPS
jgi:hypothetical protein